MTEIPKNQKKLANLEGLHDEINAMEKEKDIHLRNMKALLKELESVI